MSSPNNTIMIRGLPQYVTEQHVSGDRRAQDLITSRHVQVQDNIASHGLEVKDIRLIRKKDTGRVALVEQSYVIELNRDQSLAICNKCISVQR